MVILIRGLPASGKSTFAKTINCFHIEADMFFVRGLKYEWTKTGLKYAHQFCFNMFKEAVLEGVDVAVSNTFTTFDEIAPYINFAKENTTGYHIFRMGGTKGDNGHNVPQEAIDRMKARFEDIEGEIII